MGLMRISALEKWLDFYISFFPEQKGAEKFIELCEGQQPPNNLAKILMHQAKRLITLADDILNIRPHEESLQILFLIMCTENISKLHDSYYKEGKSRYYVHRFFEKFLSNDDKRILGNGFIDMDDIHLNPLGLKKVVDMLYDIRCDVVHEGNYSFFSFHNGKYPIQNTDPAVKANLKYIDVRNIIVRGRINAINDKL